MASLADVKEILLEKFADGEWYDVDEVAEDPDIVALLPPRVAHHKQYGNAKGVPDAVRKSPYLPRSSIADRVHSGRRFFVMDTLRSGWRKTGFRVEYESGRRFRILEGRDE